MSYSLVDLHFAVRCFSQRYLQSSQCLHYLILSFL
jgi:hypothetical protein